MHVSVFDVSKMVLKIRNEPQPDGGSLQIVSVSMFHKSGKDLGLLVATYYARKGEQEMDVQITPIESDESSKGESDVSEA